MFKDELMVNVMKKKNDLKSKSIIGICVSKVDVLDFTNFRLRIQKCEGK
jgi:hypothetical protein